MDSKARLDNVRSELVQLGVLDVKFFFKKGVSDHSCSDVSEKVATFLEGYLSGSFHRVDSFGDRPQVV